MKAILTIEGLTNFNQTLKIFRKKREILILNEIHIFHCMNDSGYCFQETPA